MRNFVSVLLLAGLMACTTSPSATTSFTAQQISPAPGSVIDLSTGATITIVGPLSIQEGIYYTMVYVRDDGTVFLPGEWGPSSSASSWSEYTFRQDVDFNSHVSAQKFARFCSRGIVTEAVFVTSNTDILVHTALNNPNSANIFENFNWNIVNYRVDIPLNYSCN